MNHFLQILMDFNLRFGPEANTFLETWNKCKDNIKFVYGLHEQLNSFVTEFDEETEDFLMLLKLLAERQKGRKTQKTRLHFDKLIDKLVVFSKVIRPTYV